MSGSLRVFSINSNNKSKKIKLSTNLKKFILFKKKISKVKAQMIDFVKKNNLHDIDTLLIHFDMDVYEPTKLILNFVRNSKKKTIIMFDEFYNYEEFEKHEWRAFYEEIVCNNVNNKMLFYTDCSSKNFGHLSKFCFEIN